MFFIIPHLKKNFYKIDLLKNEFSISFHFMKICSFVNMNHKIFQQL
ncbi:hypothetical protein LEP1GSC166_2457 [Leptospira kirschneri]|nr:hypothetical protein LEP1GSC166_2457 [Leptospira kirschneri]